MGLPLENSDCKWEEKVVALRAEKQVVSRLWHLAEPSPDQPVQSRERKVWTTWISVWSSGNGKWKSTFHPSKLQGSALAPERVARVSRAGSKNYGSSFIYLSIQILIEPLWWSRASAAYIEAVKKLPGSPLVRITGSYSAGCGNGFRRLFPLSAVFEGGCSVIKSENAGENQLEFIFTFTRAVIHSVHCDAAAVLCAHLRHFSKCLWPVSVAVIEGWASKVKRDSWQSEILAPSLCPGAWLSAGDGPFQRHK